MKPPRLLVAGLAGFLAALPGFAIHDAPPPTAKDIEADWLRQDARRTQPPGTGQHVTREVDAAGGVDGIKNGAWGFHTENEDQPWWQTDLSVSMQIDRVVLYNRTDFADRNSRIQVSVSDDGRHFQSVYQHDGTTFQGVKDQKPLTVNLHGTKGRFLRLSLPGKSYFHLDEVEVYAVGKPENIALGKPATQSSTSQWSARSPKLAGSQPAPYPLEQTLQRGFKLVESQRRLGASVDPAVRELKSIQREAKTLGANAAPESGRELYFRARRTIRQLALGNPLLNFDSLLFVKRAPTMFPHMSDQHYGWWSRGGGGIYILEDFKSGNPRVRCLTADMPAGNFVGPDLSWDGRKILFAYARYYPDLHQEKNKADKANVPADAFYHIYEMNADGSGRRQITHGRYDDFDPRWLPDGDIAFLSTRKGTALQCSQQFSDATRSADLPDSYVRCGGDNWRPVPVFTLHAMNAKGEKLRPLSAFENFEWSPSVANDGRLIYTRWDYIDRFNGHFFSLWSANQDGANPQLVYGNYTVKPQVVLEARAIPGSSKLVFTACAHHSITGGALCLLDRAQGTEFEAPITRLTPEVVFPETEGWPTHYYANPWPLSEEYFLVGWADAKLPPHTFVKDERNPGNAMGIYLYDAFGNLELLYRDADISSMYPVPLAPRPRPPAHNSVAEWNGPQQGEFLVQDIYRGMDGVRRGSIKQLRLIGVPPKVQPHQNSPVLSVSGEDPGKFVLGTVPVESDGSAYFRVPSGISLLFQALDEQGLAVQTMRSLTYVMPNQTLSCVGCHEHRDTAPPAIQPVMAVRRGLSPIQPAPEGSWPLRFDRLVQPVLDRQCVECHRPGGKDAEAAKFDLTATNAWQALLAYADGDLKKLAYEKDRSLIGDTPAAKSKLWSLLTRDGGHKDVKLDADSRERLATWMDTYAHRLGHYSEAQEHQLEELRRRLAWLHSH